MNLPTVNLLYSKQSNRKSNLNKILIITTLNLVKTNFPKLNLQIRLLYQVTRTKIRTRDASYINKHETNEKKTIAALKYSLINIKFSKNINISLFSTKKFLLKHSSKLVIKSKSSKLFFNILIIFGNIVSNLHFSIMNL